MDKPKTAIPTIFKVSGVSFHRDIIDTLECGQELKLEKDPDNKYDCHAIKILNSENRMCGFVPKKYEINGEEFILNQRIIKKFEKLTTKYKLVVHSLYKWDGPTGLQVRFDKII